MYNYFHITISYLVNKQALNSKKNLLLFLVRQFSKKVNHNRPFRLNYDFLIDVIFRYRSEPVGYFQSKSNKTLTNESQSVKDQNNISSKFFQMNSANKQFHIYQSYPIGQESNSIKQQFYCSTIRLCHNTTIKKFCIFFCLRVTSCSSVKKKRANTLL